MHAERHPLENLERWPDLNGQCKRLFRFLWEECGNKPGECLETHSKMAYELGAGRNATIPWLQELVEAGLVQIVLREGRRGSRLRIRIFQPQPRAAPRTAVVGDLQLELDCRTASRESDNHQPDLQTPKPHCQISGPESDNENDCQISGPESDNHKPLTPNTLTDLTPRDCQISGPKSDISPHGPLEKQIVKAPLPLEAFRTESAPEPMDHGGRGAKCAMQRGGTATIGEVLVASIRTDWAHQAHVDRAELIRLIVAAVGDPLMHVSIPGRAADAVLSGAFEREDLEEILAAVARKRRQNELSASPRAYFRARCIRAGMAALRYRE